MGEKWGAFLFKWSIITLGFSLSCAKFMVSVSQFAAGACLVVALCLGWIPFRWPERKFLFPIVLLLIHFLWFLPGGDWQYGLHDLKIKAPLVVIALCFALAPKHWLPTEKQLFHFCVAGLAASTLFSLLLFLEWVTWKEITSFRSYSPLISHIRLSTIGALLLLWSTRIWKSSPWKIIGLAGLVGLLFIILQSITGIALLTIALFIKGLISKRWHLQVAATIIPLLVALSIGALWISYNTIPSDYVHQKDFEYTASGNIYAKPNRGHQVENHYPIWEYVHREEMRTAWENKTGISADSIIGQGKVQHILHRYLTSKGLRKDKEGVEQLTQTDIQNILQGHPSVERPQQTPLTRRLHAVFFELNSFRDGHAPNGHSITLRWAYLKAGFHIWKNHFFWGVGTCNPKTAFETYYRETQTNIHAKFQRRTHNQWLTFLISFGCIGFLLITASLVWSLAPVWKKIIPGGLTMLLCIFISFLWEDAIETQIGLCLFVFFFCAIVYYMISPKSSHITK